MKVTIAEGEGYEFAEGEEGFELIATIKQKPRRWTTTHTAVLRHTETGKVYGYDYERGNTECQENDYPDGEIELREMKSEKVTTEVWVYV